MVCQAKNLDAPDDKLTFEHGHVQLVSLTGVTFGRAVFSPGWRWSSDVKPAAGTGSCQMAHTGVVIAGRFHVHMDDGTELDLGPGDAHVVSPGHDAWVVGDEDCVIIDVAPTAPYIERPAETPRIRLGRAVSLSRASNPRRNRVDPRPMRQRQLANRCGAEPVRGY
jgi:hypothetical protein